MTDNEIIKALGQCSDADIGCSNCPLYSEDYCRQVLDSNALDIIKRQKVEIDELQLKNSELKKEIAELQKGVEFDIDHFSTEYDEKIKAEAVKEFAERVKLDFYHEFDELIPSVMADKIDKLVKEMVGENDE